MIAFIPEIGSSKLCIVSLLGVPKFVSYLVENPKNKFSRDEAIVQKGNVLY